MGVLSGLHSWSFGGHLGFPNQKSMAYVFFLNFLVKKVDLNFEVNVPIVDVDLLIRLIIFKDLDIFFDPLDFKASNNALNHPMLLCFLLAATTCG
jgi:hypothetical protein